MPGLFLSHRPHPCPVGPLCGLSRPARRSQGVLTASGEVLGYDAAKQICHHNHTLQSSEFLPLSHGAGHGLGFTIHPESLASLNLLRGPAGTTGACFSGRETQDTVPPTFAALEAVHPKEGRQNRTTTRGGSRRNCWGKPYQGNMFVTLIIA